MKDSRLDRFEGKLKLEHQRLRQDQLRENRISKRLNEARDRKVKIGEKFEKIKKELLALPIGTRSLQEVVLFQNNLRQQMTQTQLEKQQIELSTERLGEIRLNLLARLEEAKEKVSLLSEKIILEQKRVVERGAEASFEEIHQTLACQRQVLEQAPAVEDQKKKVGETNIRDLSVWNGPAESGVAFDYADANGRVIRLKITKDGAAGLRIFLDPGDEKLKRQLWGERAKIKATLEQAGLRVREVRWG